ncbi:uncharacterized protein [Choristoneura fumiferana]|uniref:uncharacterized protein n=1 Tax=Choristoneura fumiferana TaxID=7141 RepID=UPI003D1566B6
MLHKTTLFYLTSNIFTIVLGVEKISSVGIQEDGMEMCIVNMLSYKSQLGSDLAIINNDVVTNRLIQKMHDTFNVKLYVKDYNVSVSTSPSTYIIHVQDLFQLENLIDNLDRDWHRKPEALFIIILKNISEDHFRRMFKMLWEYHIIHVLTVVDISGKNSDNASVYSYFPYAEGGCGRDYNNTIKICECKHVMELDIIATLHKRDKPVLKNCTIQIGTRKNPPLSIPDQDATSEYTVGIERLLLELLLQRENISWHYVFLSEDLESGHVHDNFTINGMLEKLYENEIDVLFGGFIVNNKRSIFFDLLCNHLAFQDNFITIVPNAGQMEKWKMLYIMFDLAVWLFLLLVILICTVILSDFGNSATMQKLIINNSELFNLIGSATQNQTLHLRDKKFKNLIIVHWLWFIFLVNCFYSTRLTSYSTYRSYKPQINDYESLYSYNFTPCLTKDIMLFFNDSGKISEIHEGVLKIDICRKVEDCLMDVAENNTKYSSMPHFRTLWWIAKHPKEKKRIHIMKANLFKTMYSFLFKRGFPLLHEFNTKMLRIVESGFLQGFKRFHRIDGESYSISVSLEITFLRLEDLTVPFSLLISGEIVSLLVFVLEINQKQMYKLNIC